MVGSRVCSSSSDGNCPGSKFLSSSSEDNSSSGVPVRGSGVPVRAKRHGKPAVDLHLGAVQLKPEAFDVRDNLNSYEQWGFNAKRLWSVTRSAVCSCERQFHQQVPHAKLAWPQWPWGVVDKVLERFK